ncbi:hypothetical protein GWI33_020350 [Rhynchophorus ferrugineus]|uniref:Uncharacterized protein n=1 Tax=Rhynchophorus ferrugineus TaxID=354439 RepID=A0A834I3J5_RHYFE|nr:hypothetical protein GWI33_020350 [Rhynchophorus ferrugineus]
MLKLNESLLGVEILEEDCCWVAVGSALPDSFLLWSQVTPVEVWSMGDYDIWSGVGGGSGEHDAIAQMFEN